jgi:hypothetical protein
MSLLGHFRRINDVYAMSAFHPIATKLLHYGKSRYGPFPDSCTATLAGASRVTM